MDGLRDYLSPGARQKMGERTLSGLEAAEIASGQPPRGERCEGMAHACGCRPIDEHPTGPHHKVVRAQQDHSDRLAGRIAQAFNALVSMRNQAASVQSEGAMQAAGALEQIMLMLHPRCELRVEGEQCTKFEGHPAPCVTKILAPQRPSLVLPGNGRSH